MADVTVAGLLFMLRISETKGRALELCAGTPKLTAANRRPGAREHRIANSEKKPAQMGTLAGCSADIQDAFRSFSHSDTVPTGHGLTGQPWSQIVMTKQVAGVRSAM